MNRLPLAAFAALVAATVGAFFVTQHLKVSTPLIAGLPRPTPAVISPAGNGCGGAYRSARFSFYLLNRADDVAVYVVDQSGRFIRTLAAGRHMDRKVRTDFPWDGREDGGRVAPDGTYYFRVALLHQNRTVEYTRVPVQVKSAPPRPIVTSVAPSLLPQGGTPAEIHYRGNERRGAVVRIYRTDLPGAPRLVKSYPTPGAASTAQWNGRIQHRPAAPGTYLIGLDVTDRACNTGRFPPAMPPTAGSTPHAGVTVRYLAAQPPLEPIPAGATSTVYVDARHQPYSWTLQRPDAPRVLARGASRTFALPVRLPAPSAAVYVLSLRSGNQRTSVPLVASDPGSAHHDPNRLLVVLPALTWQGLNPVDDDFDGLPNTLDSGGPVSLHRPLADGLPAGLTDEAALLRHLDRAHLAYDLTTDLGLIDGTGPALSGYPGVVLAGSERWLPATLGTALRTYVLGGGHVLSLGIDSLRRGVAVHAGEALHPSAAATADIFGARPGSVSINARELLTVTRDGLGIFSSTSGAFAGYSSYEQFAPGSQPFASAAGVGGGAASIAGYRLGHGIVVEIGLVGFGASLARNVDGQELLARLWQVLGA